MTIAATETYLLATLRAALAGRVRTIDSLPGEWDIALLSRMLTLAPFVVLGFTGGPAVGAGGVLASITGSWEVYVGCNHASGQQARRMGDAMQLGAYELLEAVVGLLHGHLVPGVGTLAMSQVDNFYSGEVDKQGLVVYGVRFALPMSFERAAPDGSALAGFAVFDARYDTTPLANAAQHAAWLAGDLSASAPDARDVLALPLAT